MLWPVFDNLLPSFEAQLGDLSENAVAEKERELRGRYRLVFEKAKAMHGVAVCVFHRLTGQIFESDCERDQRCEARSDRIGDQ